MTKEVWKDIPGYEDIYQASSFGNIRSIDRIVNGKNGSKVPVSGRVLKPAFDKDGYKRVSLSKENKQKNKRVNRLIAETFLENKNNYACVDHINNIKDDDRVINLRWCSNKQNRQFAKEDGLMKGRKGIAHHNCKLTETSVIEIKKLIKYTDLSNLEIAVKYGVGKTAISKIRCGVRWSHITLDEINGK